MPGAFDYDSSELRRLSSGLGAATTTLPREARAVVSKGALNIKNGTRRRVSSNPMWKHLRDSVTYGLSGNAYFSEAEVGYEDRGQGELAGIAEFGSARHAPNPALIPAAKEEEPRFKQALLDAATKLVEDAL